MKRWLAIILLIIFLAGTITIPAAAVSDGWQATDNFNSDIHTSGDPITGETSNILIFQGTTTLHNNTPKGPMAGKFVCSGTNCSKQDIFLDGIFTVDFTDEYGHPPYSFIVQYRGSETGAPIHTVSASCSSSHCAYHFYAILPASEISGSQSVAFHASVHVSVETVQGGAQTYSIYLRMSNQSLSTNDCSSKYEPILVTAAGPIDPTKEAGETSTVIPGRTYLLTVDGGPWYSSASPVAGRYDTAVKLGSADWQQTQSLAADGDIVDCIQNDSQDSNKVSFVFTAQPDPDPLTAVDFAIRVNDTAGAFADNHDDGHPMTYSLQQVQPIAGYGCDKQFLTGSQLAAGTIDATLQQGVKIKTSLFNMLPLTAGAWVKIVISGGPWYDDGTGDPRHDAAIQTSTTGWHELSTDSNSNCSVASSSGSTYLVAYIQLPTADGFSLRVNDMGANWSANTGSLNYTVSSAIYSPVPAAGCAERYQLGNLINTWNVQANNADGQALVYGPNLPNQATQTGSIYETGDKVLKYIAIETSGVWYSGTYPLVGGEIVKNPDETLTDHSSWNWSTLSDFSDRSCTVVLDPIGHVRMYFPYDQTAQYWLRVHDTNFTDNSGALTFKIYEATNLQPPTYSTNPETPLGDSTCNDYYSHETNGATFTIQGTNSAGVALPVPTSGQIYAFETSGGPWTDHGVSSYSVSLSEDNGATWQDLRSFDGAVCMQSSDGQHVLVYWQGLQGRRYKVRVSDSDGNWTNNAGSINMIYYQANDQYIQPWNGCDANYRLTLMDIPEDNRKIPAQQSTGIGIPYIESGKAYALEISPDHAWKDSILGSDLYTAHISDDNGSTWNHMNSTLDGNKYPCVVFENGPDSPIRIYFVANGSYRLRVADDVGIWPSNVGYLEYLLYSAEVVSDNTGNNNTNVPGANNGTTTPYIPPSWSKACYATSSRPNYFTKNVSFSLGSISFGSLGTVVFPSISLPVPAIDDWLEYASWTIRHFFAFCPEHASALASLGSDIYNYEPFGTFREVYLSINHFTQRMVTLTGSGGESGQSFTPYDPIFGGSAGGENGSSSGWNGILPVLDSNSPWNGGKLVYDPKAAQLAEGGEQPYFDYCQATYNAHLGFTATLGLCAVFKLSRMMGFAWILSQLAIDVSAIFTLIKYIKANWIDTGASA